jgi:SagB-type dehydrogenase family enzyme
LPGIYHYDNAHHAMERLFTGNVTRNIQAATFDHPAASTTDQFLLITLNFWKNAFKYNSFCYHAVTQDHGALLSSLDLAAKAYAINLRFLSWFQDETLNRLLGLATQDESVFSVIPLPSAPASFSCAFPTLDAPLVNKKSFQRSREVLHFPLSELVHQATLLRSETRPAANALLHAKVDILETSGERVELPPPALDHLQDDIAQVFQKRASSFGNFSSHVPLSRDELATLLYCGANSGNALADVKQENGEPHFSRLLVFVNNVEGIERGTFSYDREQHCLHVIQQDDFRLFLQTHYFLLNYNLAETGVVIAIAGGLDRMLDVFGNRGYRILNAEVGMAAQRIYMAAAALDIGCGAVLGFDNRAMNKALALDTSDQSTLLLLLVGHERLDRADFDGRLL